MVNWKKLENLPTLELIEMIKMRKQEDKEELADAAFLAFTFRFSEEVTKKCEIICKNWGKDAEFASEVASLTFKRFYKYPKFDYTKANIKNVDNAVLVYLFRFSKNILTDLYNAEKGIKYNPYDGNEEIVWNYPLNKNECEELENPKSRSEIIKKALSTLSEKHRIIFLTYAKYEETGFKLPRKLLSILRDKLGVSQTTIRSYKNEAKNKIKEYLDIYENQ